MNDSIFNWTAEHNWIEKKSQFANDVVIAANMQTLLNANQSKAFNRIIIVINVDSTTAHFFSVWKSEETEKNFLYKTLCHHYHDQEKQIVCVIFIKIMIFFLSKGRTSHSAFEIFIEYDENSTFVIKKNNSRDRFFTEIDLIIWNEIIM